MSETPQGTSPQLRALRGATTASANSAAAIGEAVAELLDALVERNGLEPDHLVSITFSVTADLDACFPAAIARRRAGWDGVALLDCQQMAVAGDLPRCIRLLAHAWLAVGQPVGHAYLREASRLRPDLATVPQGTAPQGSVPQGTAPQGSVPQGTAPQGSVPQA